MDFSPSATDTILFCMARWRRPPTVSCLFHGTFGQYIMTLLSNGEPRRGVGRGSSLDHHHRRRRHHHHHHHHVQCTFDARSNINSNVTTRRAKTSGNSNPIWTQSPSRNPDSGSGSGSGWLPVVDLTSHWTHYRSYRGRFFTGQMTQPTVSKHWRKMVKD